MLSAQKSIPRLSVLSPKQTGMSSRFFKPSQRTWIKLEDIEIINDLQEQEQFDKLIQIWNQNNIPGVHQKYFYYILKNSNRADQLIRNEIDTIKNGTSAVLQLYKLTRARERCIYEIEKFLGNTPQDIMKFVRQASQFIYDLRVLSVNLVQKFKQWNLELAEQHSYLYQWIYKEKNYIIKLKSDYEVFKKNSILRKFYNFVLDDIFYLAIVQQSYQADLDYDDHLSIHRLKERQIALCQEMDQYIRSLQNTNQLLELLEIKKPPLPSNTLQKQISDQNLMKNNSNTNLMKNFNSNSNLLPPSSLRTQQVSNKVSNRASQQLAAPSSQASLQQIEQPEGDKQQPQVVQNMEPLPEYESHVIYRDKDLHFIMKVWAFKDMYKILKYWRTLSLPEYVKSFPNDEKLTPDIFGYGYESCMFQIDNYGLMLCSVDSDTTVRRWQVNFILSQQDNFKIIITHFIKLLFQQGDPFEEFKINLFHYGTEKQEEHKPFLAILKEMKFRFRISANDPIRNIRYTTYILKVGQLGLQRWKTERIYYEPIVLQIARLYQEKYIPKFYSDEEMLEAQFCNNLGTSKYIQFDEYTLALADAIKKQKIVGQYFKAIEKKQLLEFFPEFQSPCITKVLFQQFEWSYKLLSSTLELHKERQQFYIRVQRQIIDGEPSIIEATSNDTTIKKKLFLISTNDPFIKIYLYDLTTAEITTNVSDMVNRLFETYENKKEATQNLWLPLINAKGNKTSIINAQMNSYFTNQTVLKVHQEYNGMKSTNFLVGADKLFNPPFLFGVVQTDIDNVQKPIFTLLVQDENVNTQIPEQVTIPKLIKSPFEINVLQFSQKEIQNILQQIFRFQIIECLQSFEQDPKKLQQIMMESSEYCVVTLTQATQTLGYALIRSDQGTIKKWVIETLSLFHLRYFQDLIQNVIQFIFENDPYCSEIYITQNFHEQDGILVNCKEISEAIKLSGFRWKSQSHDAQSGSRKTVYYLKRPEQYKAPLQFILPIYFKSFYSLQESIMRNKFEYKLQYFRSHAIQPIEDIFHFQIESQLSDDKIFYNKIKEARGQLPADKFITTKPDQIQEFLKDLPIIPQQPKPEHDKAYCNFLNVQLKWSTVRPVMIDAQPYLEIPTDADEEIFLVKNSEYKHNIYLIRTLDLQYSMFAAEVRYDQVDKLEKNIYSYVSHLISQSQIKENKQIVKWDLCIPQIEYDENIQKECNWFQIKFSTKYNQTIPQRMMKDLNNRVAILRPPIIIGLLNEEVNKKYERPLFTYILKEFQQ